MHHRYEHYVGMHKSFTCQPGGLKGRQASACHLCLFEDIGPRQIPQPLACRHMWPAAFWTEAGRTGVLHSSLWVWIAVCAPCTEWPSPVNLLAVTSCGVSQLPQISVLR